MGVLEDWEETGPPLAISQDTTLAFKTGTWRQIRPFYQEKASPCRAVCPAGEDIARYMDLVAQGKFVAAWQAIMEENPLPGVCGRVCPHPCEAVCNRKEFDAPLAINAVERFLADEAARRNLHLPPFKKKWEERVAVIGSGPAGLSCACFLNRMGYQVTIYEADSQPGGVLRTGIPAYRLPREVLDREIENILRAGVTLKTGMRLGENLTWDDLKPYGAVFLALGLGKGRRLNLPGEEAEGVYIGVELLKDVNGGASLPVGRKAVVIGGGDVAIDVARSCLRLGWEKVVLISLESRDELPAIADDLAEALEEGVEMINGARVTRIISQAGKLSGLELVRVNFKGFQRGEPLVDEIPDSRFSLEADALIIAIGQAPHLDFLPEGIKRDGRGISVDYLGRTSLPGFFAGGDIAGSGGTVVGAIAAGKRSALAIHLFLRGMADEWIKRAKVGDGGTISWAEFVGGPEKALNRVVTFKDINLDYFEMAPRVALRRLGPAGRRASFIEVNLGLKAREAKKEASRCFSCGSCTRCDICYIFCPDMAVKKDGNPFPYRVDYDYCKGCGICVEECPREVLSVIPEIR